MRTLNIHASGLPGTTDPKLFLYHLSFAYVLILDSVEFPEITLLSTPDFIAIHDPANRLITHRKDFADAIRAIINPAAQEFVLEALLGPSMHNHPPRS